MQHKLFSTTWFALLLSLHNATGMVVSEPISKVLSGSISSRRPVYPLPQKSRQSSSKLKRYRLRRTSRSDLDAICNMLATESVDSNHFMQRLRAKSSFNEQLSHRLQAIDVGRRTYNNIKQLNDKYNMNDLLAVNGEFKTIILRAVNNASESNAWKDYQFDFTTNDSSLLHHVMVSIEDPNTGDVVGFCEIGYLEQMQCNSEERMNVSDDSLVIPPLPEEEDAVNFESDDEAKYAPAILNLVVSRSHRRLGLASRLVNFAQKYTKTQLSQNDCNVKLGLYVHPDNHSAVNLYKRKGFEVVTKSEEGLLYMTV